MKLKSRQVQAAMRLFCPLGREPRPLKERKPREVEQLRLPGAGDALKRNVRHDAGRRTS
jgi:hypothetical protein